ncbi:glycosyltransferase [Paracoccus aerius]|uniref:Glycosyltransferase family 1 protein n=1 Tax=Paracoccus aerius TaxID=1915382 RepID=A0ABS1SAV5_9RHOB|nr:glycosyltransferase [Paracoccus aerius]MBL3675660.1 glycosyltransferase family 1 protein [Paracoccus aerius]
MKKKLFILSDRSRNLHPAMCCVVEMENAISNGFEGKIINNIGLLQKDLSNSCLLFTGLNFRNIEEHRSSLVELKQRGCTVIIYVFDAWNANSYFYNYRRKLKSLVHPSYNISSFCSIMCVPFPCARDHFSESDKRLVRYVPLAVDTTLVSGLNAQRPITVLGYGRQPTDLTQVLSKFLNAPHRENIFHHTDHMKISEVSDFLMHRRHFWKLAQSSLFALAYDPFCTHPQRFPYSIVGQRWFECLSAGCVVVGRRPTASDTDELIGWQDATIEAPNDPQDMFCFLSDLIASPARIAEIRARNVEQMKARHDWIHRFSNLVAAEGI